MRLHAIQAVLLALLALAPLIAPEYWVTLLAYIGLYGLVVLGLCLLTGIAGQVSFGQAAFVGLGAYASAWLCTAHGAPPWIGLLAGPVATDNCGNTNVEVTQTSGLASGSSFPVGLTNNVFELKDAAGNKITANFSVLIVPEVVIDTFPSFEILF